jgi:cell division control protein 24
VKHLEGRIEDWKGHHLSNFGDLLLDDVFLVTKSEVDREYHVFLFEKIILCCKEAMQPPPNSRQKGGKSNSLLKKQSVPAPLSLPGGPGQPKKKNTPLLLKGRIFLNNVTQAVPTSPRQSTCKFRLLISYTMKLTQFTQPRLLQVNMPCQYTGEAMTISNSSPYVVDQMSS